MSRVVMPFMPTHPRAFLTVWPQAERRLGGRAIIRLGRRPDLDQRNLDLRRFIEGLRSEECGRVNGLIVAHSKMSFA